MPEKVLLYMDESGTKHPDKKINKSYHQHDWFSYGGVLIKENDILIAKEKIKSFLNRWPQIKYPLHSSEIRGSHNNFSWLRKNSEIRDRFLGELEYLLIDLPVIGLACVIDRPGYNKRYEDIYKSEKWKLCKTAFLICVERACKFAISNKSKLCVYVERSSKQDEILLREYVDSLMNDGHWFDKKTASKYEPVLPEQYKKTFHELKFKNKESLLTQIADLYLWPMAIGGYDKNNRAYSNLEKNGKFMNFHVAENKIDKLAIKYSCFD